MKKFICAILCVAACAAPVGYTQGIPEGNHMARPTILPSWATNTNYVGGPNVGTPTKVAPSAGRRADGWRNNDVPPAQEENYELGLVGDWINHFDSGNTIAFANLAGLTSAVDGSKIYVSDMGWYQYHGSTPFTADALRVVTATGMGVGQWIHESVVWDTLSTIAFASFANLAARTTQARTYVSEVGWYDYHSSNVATADNVWVVTATGLGSGQWVHEHWSLGRLTTAGIPGLAVVGPIPGEAFTTSTPTGKINKQVIDHGYFTHAMIAATNLSTASASLTDVQNINIGPLRAGDIIKAHLPAVAGCTAAFRAATYVSVDGGGSYVQFSPGSTFTYPGSAGPTTIAVQLDFYRAMSANSTGDVHVSIRLQSDGAATCTLSLGDSMIEVIRP